MQIILRKDGNVNVMQESYIRLKMDFQGPFEPGQYRADRPNSWQETDSLVITPYWGRRYKNEADRSFVNTRHDLEYNVALGVKLHYRDEEVLMSFVDAMDVASMNEVRLKEILKVIFVPLFERTVKVSEADFITRSKGDSPAKTIKHYYMDLPASPGEPIYDNDGGKYRVRSVKAKPKSPSTPKPVEKMPDFFASF